MSRAIERRLRKLEANASAKRLHVVWSDTSDRMEWDREIAHLIASGRAAPEDEFLRVGWLPSASA